VREARRHFEADAGHGEGLLALTLIH